MYVDRSVGATVVARKRESDPHNFDLVCSVLSNTDDIIIIIIISVIIIIIIIIIIIVVVFAVIIIIIIVIIIIITCIIIMFFKIIIIIIIITIIIYKINTHKTIKQIKRKNKEETNKLTNNKKHTNK